MRRDYNSVSARGRFIFGRLKIYDTGFDEHVIIYDSESKKSCIIDIHCSKDEKREGEYSWDTLDFKLDCNRVITIECSNEPEKKLRITSLICEMGERTVFGIQYIEPEWKYLEYSWFKPPPIFGYYEFKVLTRDMDRILEQYHRDPKSITEKKMPLFLTN